MSLAASAIGEVAIGFLPSKKIKSSKTPVLRQYVVKSDAVALPEAR
jgi:hypothetical protein